MGNAPGRVQLKKYANRRLYDTEKSAYITLNDVVEMVKQGRRVEVTDVDTGEDVTAFTLTQIIMEEAKKKNVLLPVPLLHLIIQYGETVLADFFGNYLEKMIKSYLTVKNIADEQFGKWLDVGAAINQGKNSAFSAENPFQSSFKQFFSSPKPGDEKNDKKNSKE